MYVLHAIGPYEPGDEQGVAAIEDGHEAAFGIPVVGTSSFRMEPLYPPVDHALYGIEWLTVALNHDTVELVVEIVGGDLYPSIAELTCLVTLEDASRLERVGILEIHQLALGTQVLSQGTGPMARQ